VEETLHRQCDRFGIARFTPQQEGVSISPPPPVAKPAELPAAVATSPRASARNFPGTELLPYQPNVIKVQLPLPAVLPILIIGFSAGWFSHEKTWQSETRRPSPAHTFPSHKPAEPLPPLKPLSIRIPKPIPKVGSTELIAAQPNPPPPTPIIKEAAAVHAPAAATTVAPSPKADFIAQLDSDDATVRLGAAKSLLKTSPDNEKAIATLLALMKELDSGRRLAAIQAVSVVGLDTPPVVTALAEALGDGDAVVASAAKNVLIRLGKSAVPALTDHLTDLKTRTQAIDILGQIGPAAEAAIPALNALENDPDVGIAVMKATARIQPQPRR